MVLARDRRDLVVVAIGDSPFAAGGEHQHRVFRNTVQPDGANDATLRPRRKNRWKNNRC